MSILLGQNFIGRIFKEYKIQSLTEGIGFEVDFRYKSNLGSAHDGVATLKVIYAESGIRIIGDVDLLVRNPEGYHAELFKIEHGILFETGIAPTGELKTVRRANRHNLRKYGLTIDKQLPFTKVIAKQKGIIIPLIVDIDGVGSMMYLTLSLKAHGSVEYFELMIHGSQLETIEVLTTANSLLLG